MMHFKKFLSYQLFYHKVTSCGPKVTNEDVMSSDRLAALASAGPTDGNVGQTAPRKGECCFFFQLSTFLLSK